MDLESRDKRKKLGFRRFLKSFEYSFYGLYYAIRNEQSVLIMNICLLLTVTAGFVLKITINEWIFVTFSIGLVLGSELLNTAIEATVDLVTPQFHPLAKIAKDTASASAFVFSLMAFIIGCLVFIPNLIELIGGK